MTNSVLFLRVIVFILFINSIDTVFNAFSTSRNLMKAVHRLNFKINLHLISYANFFSNNCAIEIIATEMFFLRVHRRFLSWKI